MVNALFCLLICVVFSVDFLKAEFSFLPRLITWMPELLSGGLLLFVAVFGKHLRIPGKYLLWGLMLLLLMAIGAIANEVQPGATFYGIRKYLRFVPVFLLLLVYPFSEREIRMQLGLVLLLSLVQIVPAVYQRMVVFPTNPTGDVIVGTVMAPAQLSILQLSVICVLTAFFIRRRLPLVRYALLSGIVVSPTLLNETAANMVLLPLAVLAPLALAGELREQLRRFLPVLMVMGVLLGAFLVTYSVQFDRWGGDPSEVVTGGGLDYFYRGATEDSRADEGREQSEIGRLDSIILPLIVLDDPVQWFVGVGIGNASSASNDLFVGDYTEAAERYGATFTTLGVLVWEVGILGVLMTLLFMWMVFRDAMRMRDHDGIQGTLALGFAGILCLMGVVLFYRNIIDNTVTSFSLTYLCGLLIAMRDRLATRASGAGELTVTAWPHPGLAGSRPRLHD